MKGVGIKVKGLDRIRKKYGELPRNVVREADSVMATAAVGFENRAQNDAPQDQRILANSISTERRAEMDYKIVSHANYSAYVEFGTKSKFRPIAGVDSSKFKGKGSGGSYEDFVNNIYQWVKRKGIASRFSVKTRRALKATKEDEQRIRQAAEAIAHSIIKNGINPHPFFFKQLPIAQAELKKQLPEALKKAMK